MVGIMAFVISIVSTVMIFIPSVRLPAFVIAILGIVFGVIGGYEKDNEEKEQKEKAKKKDPRALEIGAIIISGAVCLSYLILLYVS